MAALALVLLIILGLFHWLASPLLHALVAPFELQALPWLLLGLGAWMLSGAPGTTPGDNQRGE